jgi:uncharacterized protein Yka (UPF0111/DUF47 family)
MKLFKEKKNELDEVNREFLSQSLNNIITLHELVNLFINKKLNKKDLEKVIQGEKKCDRIKEKYVQVLFRDKRALPFLVEDRYNILMMLDETNDKIEFFARFFAVFPFDLYDLIGFTVETVEELLNCATLIETDFKDAYDKTFEIEAVRRKARKAKFDLLDVVFKKTDNPTKIYLTSKLVTYIYEIAAWAEEVSDYLRGLIIKYPSR